MKGPPNPDNRLIFYRQLSSFESKEKLHCNLDGEPRSRGRNWRAALECVQRAVNKLVRRTRLALMWAALCVLLSPRAGQTDEPAYTLTILPDLEVDGVVYDRIVPGRLNNRGTVVGVGWTLDPAAPSNQVLFHFRRGRMRRLETQGMRTELVRALSRRGVVVGQHEAGSDKRLFKTSRKGFQGLLVGGLPDEEVGRLRFTDLGPGGEVLAYTADPGVGVPYIHRGGAAGWELIAAEDPVFELAQRFPTSINSAGDILFEAYSADAARATVFILRADGDVEVVRPEAEGLAISSILTASRRTAGSAIRDGRYNAFYYDPEEGLRDVHPQGFEESFGFVAREDGTALVAARSAGRFNYFRFRPDTGLVPLWGDSHLDRLGEAAGCHSPEKAEVSAVFYNQRGEALGRLSCTGRGGAVHFTEARGFTVIRDVLKGLGLASRHNDPVGLNDKGQILLSAFVDEEHRAVLLTPARGRSARR